MTKRLTAGLLVAVCLGFTACKSKTTEPEATSTVPEMAAPEPETTVASMDTTVPEPQTTIPEFVPSAPVQSLGASSSGLGR